MKKSYIQIIALLVLVTIFSGCQIQDKSKMKCGIWVDAYRGEPIAYDHMLNDIAGVDVVYLGERHTIL